MFCQQQGILMITFLCRKTITDSHSCWNALSSQLSLLQSMCLIKKSNRLLLILECVVWVSFLLSSSISNTFSHLISSVTVFWATAVGTIGLFVFTVYYLAIGASSVSAFANISTYVWKRWIAVKAPSLCCVLCEYATYLFLINFKYDPICLFVIISQLLLALLLPC
jgi:hypothetical protein